MSLECDDFVFRKVNRPLPLRTGGWLGFRLTAKLPLSVTNPLIIDAPLLFLNFLLFLSTFSVVLNDYFFRWLVYKFLLSRFLVLINYIIWSYNLFSVSNVFQGPGFYRPGFSGSESTVWNQVLEVAQL